MIRTVSHREFLKKFINRPGMAYTYLHAEAEGGDLYYLLKALREVVDAQGGIGMLAKKTKLSRTSLYKTLSEKGNPEVATLDAILKVYGLRIGFFPVKRRTKKAA